MSFGTALADVVCSRVMTAGDPVVRFPPWFWEAPLATIAVGELAAIQWSTYAHGPGGLRILDSHVLIAAENNVFIQPQSDVGLLSWLVSSAGMGHPEHNLTTYLQRLTVPVLTKGPPIPPTPAGFKGELAVQLAPDIFNLGPVAGPVAAKEVFTLAGESIYIPPEHKAHAQRIGKTWYVIWEGQQIAVGTTQSKAKTIAKYLNRFLRITQNTTLFYATNFQSASAGYFSAASDPTQEFVPVLQVQF
jgi:hypothetical protein